MISQLDRDKADLRARLVDARRQLGAGQRAAAARSVRDAVLSLPEAQMAGTVAAYYSIGTEPDTHGLVFGLWKRGTYVLLPVLRDDGDLDWASYEGPDSLRPGPRGLTEPSEPAAASPPSPAPTWWWSRHWRWIIPGCGWAVAVARSTARWPGSVRLYRSLRCCMTPSCWSPCPLGRMTSRCAWWPGLPPG